MIRGTYWLALAAGLVACDSSFSTPPSRLKRPEASAPTSVRRPADPPSPTYADAAVPRSLLQIEQDTRNHAGATPPLIQKLGATAGAARCAAVRLGSARTTSANGTITRVRDIRHD